MRNLRKAVSNMARWAKGFFRMVTHEIPSITDGNRRWAFFQTMLTFAFGLFALAIAILTMQSRGAPVVIAWVLIVIGLASMAYAIVMGLYWFSKGTPKDSDAELHNDIKSLVTHIDALIEKMGKER